MANDAALKIPVEARLDQFGKDMETLGRQADTAVDTIAKKFAALNPGIAGKFVAGVAGGIIGSIGIDKLLDVIVEANKQMADLEKNSKAVGLTLSRFQELRFAGNLKGLDDSGFQEGINGIATRLNEAQRQENDLTKLLDANNIKYKDREGKIIDVNAALMISANLIRNAGTELDKVKIAEMLGLSKQWVPVLEQGAEQFKAVADSARESGAIISDQVVAKAAEFDREWKASSAKWSTSMRAAALEILPVIDTLIDKASALPSLLGSGLTTARAMLKRSKGLTDSPPGSGATGLEGLTLEELKALPGATMTDMGNGLKFGATADSEVIRAEIERRQVQEDELRRERGRPGGAASPTRLTVTNANPTKIPVSGKDDAESGAFDAAEDRLKRRIALYDAEAASVGKTTLEKEKARAEAELLAAAERAGIEVDDELKTKIEALGLAYGQSAERARAAKTAFEGVNDASRYFGNAVGNILDQIGSKTKGIDILRNSLRGLLSELQRAILTGEGSFAKLLGTASGTGGTGGIFGSLGTIFGGGRDTGGDVEAGRAYQVNENTPNSEWFVPKTPGTVMHSAGGGGTSVSVVQHIQFSSGINGTDRAALSREIAIAGAQAKQGAIAAVQGMNRRTAG